MIDFIAINMNLLPFFIMFMTGMLFLLIAPISFRIRTKAIIILPTTILRYHKYEKLLLVVGAILVAWSLLSLERKCSTDGYNTYITDVNGKRRIERIIPGSYD